MDIPPKGKVVVELTFPQSGLELLLTGTKPDLDNVQGLMAEVIQGAPHGFKDMRREDALAIADYLKSIGLRIRLND